MAMSIPCQRRCWIARCTRPEGAVRSRRVRIRMSKLLVRQSGSRSCDGEIDLSLISFDNVHAQIEVQLVAGYTLTPMHYTCSCRAAKHHQPDLPGTTSLVPVGQLADITVASTTVVQRRCTRLARFT